jgi:hypothetical protein
MIPMVSNGLRPPSPVRSSSPGRQTSAGSGGGRGSPAKVGYSRAQRVASVSESDGKEPVRQPSVSSVGKREGPVIKSDGLGEGVDKDVPEGSVIPSLQKEGGRANSQAPTAISRGPAVPSNTVEHGENVPEQVSVARGSDGPVIGLEKLGEEVDNGVPEGLVEGGRRSSRGFQVPAPSLSQALHGLAVKKDTLEGEEGDMGDKMGGGKWKKGVGREEEDEGQEFSEEASGPLTSNTDNGKEGDTEVIREGREGGGERFDEREEGGSERREYEEQEGEEEEENGMPHVVVNCLSKDAVNSEPFISTLNLHGYSMVTKAELMMYFLPEDWRGTVVVKPAMVNPLGIALSPEPDLEGTGLMWRLGEGAYSMEAIRAQGRQSGQPMQQGSKGVRKCSTAPSVSVGASVRRSFHTAATSFASIASLSTGSPLKLPTRRKGQGPSNSLSMYLADKFGKWSGRERTRTRRRR